MTDAEAANAALDRVRRKVRDALNGCEAFAKEAAGEEALLISEGEAKAYEQVLRMLAEERTAVCVHGTPSGQWCFGCDYEPW